MEPPAEAARQVFAEAYNKVSVAQKETADRRFLPLAAHAYSA